MWRFVLFLTMLLTVNCSMALALADFVPKFLLVKSNSSTQTNNATNTQTNNATNTYNNDFTTNAVSGTNYCDNGQYMSSSSVFCNNKKESYLFGGDIPGISSSSSVSSDTNSSNVAPKTPTSSANQNALQGQELKNAMNKYKSNYNWSIEPSENVKMNVGINQLQLNIKY